VFSTLSLAPSTSTGVLNGAAIEKAAQAKVVRRESDGKCIFLSTKSVVAKERGLRSREGGESWNETLPLM
jgi:hypothetical protein